MFSEDDDSVDVDVRLRETRHYDGNDEGDY